MATVIIFVANIYNIEWVLTGKLREGISRGSINKALKTSTYNECTYVQTNNFLIIVCCHL